MARYMILPDWSVESTTTIDDGETKGAVITVETASLKDTRSGHVYAQGAYRVRVRCEPTRPDQPRTRTFKGETAWSQAERYAEDTRWYFRRLGWI
jgi:hypothetical protein